MHRTGRNAAVAVLSAALLAGVAAPATAQQGSSRVARSSHKVHETAEHALIHWINVQRRNHGLRALAPAADLTRVAHLHTDAMIKTRTVSNDRHLGTEVKGWLRLGEDVGTAGSLASMEYALLHTSSDRVNVLGPGFRDIGVGAGGRNGLLYVTVLVRQPLQPSHH